MSNKWFVDRLFTRPNMSKTQKEVRLPIASEESCRSKQAPQLASIVAKPPVRGSARKCLYVLARTCSIDLTVSNEAAQLSGGLFLLDSDRPWLTVCVGSVSVGQGHHLGESEKEERARRSLASCLLFVRLLPQNLCNAVNTQHVSGPAGDRGNRRE